MQQYPYRPSQFAELAQLLMNAPRKPIAEAGRRGVQRTRAPAQAAKDARPRPSGQTSASRPARATDENPFALRYSLLPTRPLEPSARVVDALDRMEEDRRRMAERRRRERQEGLGYVSESVESGGRGVATVSPGRLASGRPDPGGISYGPWQMSSAYGVPERFLLEEGQAWRDNFEGMRSGTPEFTAEYKRLAQAFPEVLRRQQHSFIRRTHYEPLLDRIQAATAVDLSRRSNALNEALWSYAVQPIRRFPITGIVNQWAWQSGGPLDDLDLIDQLYATRTRHYPDDAARYRRERDLVADMYALETLGQEPR